MRKKKLKEKKTTKKERKRFRFRQKEKKKKPICSEKQLIVQQFGTYLHLNRVRSRNQPFKRKFDK